MEKATGSPFQSQYGFKSNGFKVDSSGNITANSLSLEVNLESAIVNFEFIDDGFFYFLINNPTENPTLTLEKNKTYIIRLSLTEFTFNIFGNDQDSYADVTLSHSAGFTGTDAQAKSTGLLSITIPVDFSETVIYYGNVDKTVLGTINVIDPTGIFGHVNITDTIESLDPTTGSLVVTGGVGIGKNLSIGGDLQISTVSIEDSITFSTPDSLQIGIIDDTGSSIPVKNTTIQNTYIDNSIIGSTTPAAGNFTTVTGTEDPTQLNDLTNKKYVDATVIALGIAFGI